MTGTSARKCTNCGLLNPPGAVTCDCGFDFATESGGEAPGPKRTVIKVVVLLVLALAAVAISLGICIPAANRGGYMQAVDATALLFAFWAGLPIPFCMLVIRPIRPGSARCTPSRSRPSPAASPASGSGASSTTTAFATHPGRRGPAAPGPPLVCSPCTG